MVKKAEESILKPTKAETDAEYLRTGMINHIVINPDITCVSRTMKCVRQHGFNNFQILTLHIEKGKVIKMDVSDSYASFEARDKLEFWNCISFENQNCNWNQDRTWTK